MLWAVDESQEDFSTRHTLRARGRRNDSREMILVAYQLAGSPEKLIFFCPSPIPAFDSNFFVMHGLDAAISRLSFAP